MQAQETTSGALAGDALADVAEAALAREDLATALRLFDQAEPGVADPDRCSGGRWMAHMLGGDFASAWYESDAIRNRGRPDPHRFWNGQSLAGKRVILRSLHGFGDAVQMFRFLPRLQQQAADLVVEVPPRLVELAPCFDGMGQVTTWGEAAPPEPPAWDVQVEVMELPYLLRVTADHLEPRQGYLHVPEADRARVGAALGGRRAPRVGLVWGAGEWNPSRSIPFATVRPLLEVAGAEFWSLQGEPERGRWLACAEDHMPCRDMYVGGDGIVALAATVEQMDLLITVDTLAVHLAGALGVPCWLLLQHRADWRWMAGRERSPWYPSLRLWRQTIPGDWDGLIRQVQLELETRLRRGGTLEKKQW